MGGKDSSLLAAGQRPLFGNQHTGSLGKGSQDESAWIRQLKTADFRYAQMIEKTFLALFLHPSGERRFQAGIDKLPAENLRESVICGLAAVFGISGGKMKEQPKLEPGEQLKARLNQPRSGNEISRKARQARKEEKRKCLRKRGAFTSEVIGARIESPALGVLCALCASLNAGFRISRSARWKRRSGKPRPRCLLRRWPNSIRLSDFKRN